MLLVWQPNNTAQSVSQIVEWRDVNVGLWRTDQVTPSNPLSTSANTVELTGFYPNALFEVRIKMNCLNSAYSYSDSTFYFVPGNSLTFTNGITLSGTEAKLGGAAVSGTGLSTSPLTSHRDITGAFRLSLKNNRVLIGSDNVQDNILDVPGVSLPVSGDIKLNVIGEEYSQITLLMAQLHGMKTKDKNGNTIDMFDAYEYDDNAKSYNR